ncbi:MAG: alpha/beta hydrolase [Verrucomicrobia bacterium]|nr:alpha/beta hydrolase [Verrucomicrobiota bacterium]
MEGTPDTPQPPSWRKRRWARVLFAGGRIYIICVIVLFALQDRIIFPRHLAPEPLDAPYGAGAISLTIEYDNGGNGFGWYLPAPAAAPTASVETPAPCVIFFHGNGEIADYQHDVVEGYHALGFSVLLPEYRGYGRADGAPGEKAILADAERFYDLLIKRPEVDAARIVFHGRSLGGSFAAGLAARRAPSALILESTFMSVVSMARRYLLPPVLVRHPLRTDRVLRRLDVPVLIMHGRRDGVIPVAHGRKLARIAHKALYVEYDCGHMVLIDQPGYWEKIRRFLVEAGATR